MGVPLLVGLLLFLSVNNMGWVGSGPHSGLIFLSGIASTPTHISSVCRYALLIWALLRAVELTTKINH